MPLLARARAKRRAAEQLGEERLADRSRRGRGAARVVLRAARGQTPPGDAGACAQVLGFESGERPLRAHRLERALEDSRSP